MGKANFLYTSESIKKTIIPRNVKLGEAPSHGKNIIEYDVTSKGAKNYIKLAHELINNNF